MSFRLLVSVDALVLYTCWCPLDQEEKTPVGIICYSCSEHRCLFGLLTFVRPYFGSPKKTIPPPQDLPLKRVISKSHTCSKYDLPLFNSCITNPNHRPNHREESWMSTRTQRASWCRCPPFTAGEERFKPERRLLQDGDTCEWRRLEVSGGLWGDCRVSFVTLGSPPPGADEGPRMAPTE